VITQISILVLQRLHIIVVKKNKCSFSKVALYCYLEKIFSAKHVNCSHNKLNVAQIELYLYSNKVSEYVYFVNPNPNLLGSTYFDKLNKLHLYTFTTFLVLPHVIAKLTMN